MTPRLALLLVTGWAMALSSQVFAQRSDILPVQRRATTVEAAAKIVAPRTPPALPATLNNPFAPEGFAQADAGEGTLAGGASSERPRARTSRDILEVIAANIAPTGTIVLRDEPILLFGNKQTRVGEELLVTYEGATHILVVTAIQSTSFTVRLNNEEITRPIKAGSKP